MDISNRDDVLIHYGVKRRSGRYPWGSGDDPYQHSGDFLGRVEELQKKGLSEKEIADTIGLTTSQLRIQKSLAKDERRALQVARAKGLREDGKSLSEIAKIMGFNNDSSVRALLNDHSESNMKLAKSTADILKKQVDEKGMIDVGTGVERVMGVSKEKLKEALYILEMQGYPTYGGRVPQATNAGRLTTLKVLCPPGTEHKEIFNYENIHSFSEYVSRDNGKTFSKFEYPAAMDAKRLQICYAEQGGVQKDGVIEVRRGCKDLDLGNSHYAQVRIMVDGKSVGADKNRYLKGMCVYSDDLPPGIDVRFNTNKHLGTPAKDVLKTVKDDPSNPFGSLIKPNGQSKYIGEDGKEHLSLINKRAEEGDWGEWSNKLPSQFLAKQNISLIKKQIGLAQASKDEEFAEIKALTNPVVKKTLLKSFADDCDSAAVHLHAAALPRQKYQVILPVPTLKDNEVYAPNFKNGEQIALVRFPHGGTFEIPILTVNNKHADARRVLGSNPLDAIGINQHNADRLSGADFDGDTVLCIPHNSKVKISSQKALAGLEGFDTKEAYGPQTYKGKNVRLMTRTQLEMGKISNLITDMTLKGANEDELARAVRHSMVVIDAEKHKLNYKQSEIDNGISELKHKYQGHYNEQGNWSTGASTLLSRAKGEKAVIKRKGSPKIDPETGKQYWEIDKTSYIDKKTGKQVYRMQKSTNMYETDDANTLSSGTPQEQVYANYANHLKALGNSARKELISTPNYKYSPDSKNKYLEEVKTLDSKLNIALLNAPKERQAQVIANSVVAAKKKEFPDLTKKEIKKISQQALSEAREQVGSKREPVKISDREWEAIQAGAISPTKLKQIIDNSDLDRLRELATPRSNKNTISLAKENKLKAMIASGYTNAEIADAIGVSASTVAKYIKGGREE